MVEATCEIDDADSDKVNEMHGEMQKDVLAELRSRFDRIAKRKDLDGRHGYGGGGNGGNKNDCGEDDGNGGNGKDVNEDCDGGRPAVELVQAARAKTPERWSTPSRFLRIHVFLLTGLVLPAPSFWMSDQYSSDGTRE